MQVRALQSKGNFSAWVLGPQNKVEGLKAVTCASASFSDRKPFWFDYACDLRAFQTRGQVFSGAPHKLLNLGNVPSRYP